MSRKNIKIVADIQNNRDVAIRLKNRLENYQSVLISQSSQMPEL